MSEKPEQPELTLYEDHPNTVLGWEPPKDEAVRTGTRGIRDRVAVAVRLSQEDWIAAHKFADRHSVSLNEAFIEGFKLLQISHRQPPILGKLR